MLWLGRRASRVRCSHERDVETARMACGGGERDGGRGVTPSGAGAKAGEAEAEAEAHRRAPIPRGRTPFVVAACFRPPTAARRSHL
jgi:hypothetical protein